VVRGSQAVVVPETVCKISSEKEGSAVVIMVFVETLRVSQSVVEEE